MTEQELRVGIFSANWGVQAHLPAWRVVPETEVIAICTAHRETAEAAAAAHAIPRPFWDYRELARAPDLAVDVDTAPIAVYPMALLFREMARAIRTGGEAAPSFGQAYHVHRAIEAVYRSMETRSWV